jgi:hypothetical protein
LIGAFAVVHYQFKFLFNNEKSSMSARLARATAALTLHRDNAFK